MALKIDLAEFVRKIMVEKNISTYDIQRRSSNGISAATVTKIVNGDIRSSSIDTLAALAKGLGVPEDQVFRVARGLPPEQPTGRFEILAETFDGQELSSDDWREIEAVIQILVNQRKGIRSAVAERETPVRKSNFKRRQ